jgi:hypothetical protein
MFMYTKSLLFVNKISITYSGLTDGCMVLYPFPSTRYTVNVSMRWHARSSASVLLTETCINQRFIWVSHVAGVEAGVWTAGTMTRAAEATRGIERLVSCLRNIGWAEGMVWT